MGGPPSRRFLCLFWRETRQRIFGPEISPYPEVVRGHERELVGQRSWEELTTGPGWEQSATGQQRDESAGELAWNHGQMRSTPETVAEKIGSSEEDWVKMSAFQLLVEFSLVTHASVSPHMHVVLHNSSFCSWLTPSFVRVCSSVLFSPVPPIVFLWWQEMCVTPL